MTSQAPSPLTFGPGLLARRADYAPWSRIARHEHPWAFIAVVAAGIVHEECDGVRDVRGAGAVRIMPAGVPHANAYAAGGARCFIAELHDDAREHLAATRDALSRPAIHGASSAVGLLAARMYAEYRQADDLSPLALDALLCELLVAATRVARTSVPSAAPAWLQRVRDRMHDDFPAAPTLTALAREAGVHPGHLVRVFRRHFHCAPAEYVARLRIERARQALTATAAPISDIAAAAGFSDQAHFTRRFKAALGTTPARYRRESA